MQIKLSRLIEFGNFDPMTLMIGDVIHIDCGDLCRIESDLSLYGVKYQVIMDEIYIIGGIDG